VNPVVHEVLAALLVGSLYAAAFVAAEWLHRHRAVAIEITRKLVHVLGGCIALLLPALFAWRGTVPILGGLFALALLVTRRTRLLDSVHRVERVSVGEIVYPIGIAATYLAAGYAGRPIFYGAAVMTLAVADAAAGLIGSRWGRHRFRVFGDAKSVEGSAGFFLCGLFVVGAALTIEGSSSVMQVVLLAGSTALAGMFAELLAPRGGDNVAIPLVVWGVLVLTDAALR